MKNDRSSTPPSVDKLARYYEEYYKYKRLIHKIRFGRFVVSMEGIQQTIGFYDNTESNLIELNMKMDLMNLFKEIKLDYKSRKSNEHLINHEQPKLDPSQTYCISGRRLKRLNLKR